MVHVYKSSPPHELWSNEEEEILKKYVDRAAPLDLTTKQKAIAELNGHRTANGWKARANNSIRLKLLRTLYNKS